MKKKTDEQELKDAVASIKSSAEEAKRIFDIAKCFDKANQKIKMTDAQRETLNLLNKTIETASSFGCCCAYVIDMFAQKKIPADQLSAYIRDARLHVKCLCESINTISSIIINVFNIK